MIMISVPILTSRKAGGTGDSGISERTEYYTIAKHLLMSAGDAMERLMTAYKVLLSEEIFNSTVQSNPCIGDLSTYHLYHFKHIFSCIRS